MNYHGAVGGKDDTILRVLRTLISNGMAECINFAGRGSKTGITDLKILDVVIGR
mgnify:CR=1 FL=1